MNPAIFRLNILLFLVSLATWLLIMLSVRHNRSFYWKGARPALFLPFMVWCFVGWGRHDLWGEDFFSTARVVSLLAAFVIQVAAIIHAYHFGQRRGWLGPKSQILH